MSGVFCDCNRKQNSEEYYYNNINKNNKKDSEGKNYYKSVTQGLEDNLWFYNSIIKDNVLAINRWQSYIYDLYFENNVSKENQLVILNSVYERYIEIKELLDSTLDKYEINVFYRDYIKFKELLISRANKLKKE